MAGPIGRPLQTIARSTSRPGRERLLLRSGSSRACGDSDPHSEEYYYDNGMGPKAPDTFRTVVYYYDGAGNRTTVNDNGLITNYASNPLNQYDTVTASTISNGSEHEVKSYQAPSDPQLVTYTYLTDKDLVSVTSGSNSYSLAYDALGRCVKRTLNGTTTYYIYDGEKPILEYKVNPIQILARNVYGKGIDEILMRTATGINGNQPFYYQQDHEGSVTHLTNASGTVIEKSLTCLATRSLSTALALSTTGSSSPAGIQLHLRVLRIPSPCLSPHPWPVHERRSEAIRSGDYNLFRYCHNDPIDFSDPMGL